VPLGRVAFEGPGAGGPATASAVLGDLVALARGLGSTWAGLPAATARSTIAVRPVAGECVAAPSGACYPVGD
jgi:homoserine dehydrogenase